MGNFQTIQTRIRCFFTSKKNVQTKSSDLTVEQLFDVYLEKHAFDDFEFDEEFRVKRISFFSSSIVLKIFVVFFICRQTIPNFVNSNFLTSIRPENLLKNRFVDILPAESTRVRLSTIDNDPTTDFINANFISVRSTTFFFSIFHFVLSSEFSKSKQIHRNTRFSF